MEPGADETPVGEILLYTTEDGRTRLECRFVDETLWMGQSMLAELFQKDVRTINEHLKNLFAEGELDPEATIRKFRIVRREGNRQVAREIEHYSLDVAPARAIEAYERFAAIRRRLLEAEAEFADDLSLDERAKSLGPGKSGLSQGPEARETS